MDINNDNKFKSEKVFQILLIILVFISPLLLVMYFSGHKVFVLNLLQFCLFLLLVGPIINLTGVYRLVKSYFHNREDKKWEKINKKVATQIKQVERSKKLKASRFKDPNLPENW